ncbi:MAG: terminase [Clostridiales bacterium]|nr:terminase [Clostridiales bacterium]
MEIGTNRFLSGSTGKLWFNGELMANLKKVEIKVEGNFEDVTLAGDYRTYPQYTGYSVSGSVTFAKLDSGVLAKYAAAYKSGLMPELKIISKLTDVNTGASERACVSGAVLTSLPLVGFEAKGLVDEEFALKASDYDILERIN